MKCNFGVLISLPINLFKVTTYICSTFNNLLTPLPNTLTAPSPPIPANTMLLDTSEIRSGDHIHRTTLSRGCGGQRLA